MDNDPIAYIVNNMRQRDREELGECGHTPEQAIMAFKMAGAHSTVYADRSGRPAAIISFHEITPKALACALIATETWPEVAAQAYRDGVRNVRPYLLKRGYARAECRTMEGHNEAITFLEHLGFKLEVRIPRFGRTGKAFLQYAWTVDDHIDHRPAVLEQLLPQRNGFGAGEDHGL